MAWHVVIAGGGFGGLYAARALERKLPHAAARITLVNDTNFFLFTPLLPGAAGGTLEPRHVVVPLREALHHTDLRVGTVLGADPAQNTLKIQAVEGHVEELRYDHLIVALGSLSRTLPPPPPAAPPRGRAAPRAPPPAVGGSAVGSRPRPGAIPRRTGFPRPLEPAEPLDDERER